MKWKDISSFDQRDNVRTPHAFELCVGALRLRVHRHIHYDPDVWLLSCEPWFNCNEIGKGTTPEAACRDALSAVLDQLNEVVGALRSNVQ